MDSSVIIVNHQSRRRPTTRATTKQKPRAKHQKSSKSRLSMKHLAEFTRQLATLLEARLTLMRALKILAEQNTNKKMQPILAEMLAGITHGASLSEVLKQKPKIFSDFFISLVQVGEQGGILGQMLNRLAVYLEKITVLRRKILTALTYPAVILVVAIAAISFLLLAVVPSFADLFRSFGSELPGPTMVLLNISGFVRRNIVVLAAGIAAVILSGIYLQRIPRIAQLLDRLTLHIPLFGALLRKSYIAKFCRTLGTLLESGVTLIDSLTVTSRISKNTVFNNSVDEMKSRVSKGEPILLLAGKDATFPPLVAQMIRVGEETGDLDSMLLKVADFYEAELDSIVESMTAIIEPVIIVFLGVVLGGTLVALYMQLFNVVNVIQ